MTFKGTAFPFRLLGSVIGPGSVSKIDVSGDIYKLDDISQFPGPYAQGTGQIGLEPSGDGDLWLQNKAGAIMHLTGTQPGVTMSLGRDEFIIEMKLAAPEASLPGDWLAELQPLDGAFCGTEAVQRNSNSFRK